MTTRAVPAEINWGEIDFDHALLGANEPYDPAPKTAKSPNINVDRARKTERTPKTTDESQRPRLPAIPMREQAKSQGASAQTDSGAIDGNIANLREVRLRRRI